MPVRTVGIIGAGVAGLTLARRLRQAGHAAVVLDKGRGVGGRTAARRAEDCSFDHGAQCFTPREPDFASFLRETVPPDRLAIWSARFARLDVDGRLVLEGPAEPRLVGVPGMNALCQALATGLAVRTQVAVTHLGGTPGRWTLEDAHGQASGPFDWVVSTAPPAQSAALLAASGPLAEALGGVAMRPCFSLMLGPEDDTEFPADGITCEAHPVLGWVANNHRKPGRPGGPALVIQSSHAWAEAHLDDPRPEVARALAAAAASAFGITLDRPVFESVHRWLFAAPAAPGLAPYLADADRALAAGGDWCGDGTIEGAYRSGDALARMLITA